MRGDGGNLVVKQCSAIWGGDLHQFALAKVTSSQSLRPLGNTRSPDGHS